MSEEKQTPIKKVAETIGQQKETFPSLGALDSNDFNSSFEIMPGITMEEMKALFFDSDALIEPPYKIWRLTSKSHRYYYTYDKNGNIEFFGSATTILSHTLPMPAYLREWIAETGIEESERYKLERGSYGKFMHGAFAELSINRTYDLDELKGRLKSYIEKERLPDNFIYYEDDLKKDVLAFAQFILDYDVKPLAVEIALIHHEKKYAGQVDLPCTMLERIGGKNRINAIIDFKSGRKGFHEDHEIQLHLYKDMWNANFPQLPIDRVFNFSPKNWRKKPTYHLKDQTKSINAKKIPYLLGLWGIEDDKKENIFTMASGLIELDSCKDLENNVISLTLSELAKTKSAKDCPDKNTLITPKDL